MIFLEKILLNEFVLHIKRAEITNWKKYLLSEFKNNKSSTKPTIAIIEQITIPIDNSFKPSKGITIRHDNNEIATKNIPPDLSLFFSWEDLELGISKKILPIYGVTFFINKLVKNDVAAKINRDFKIINFQ